MKILFYLYRYPGYGGIETVTRIISSELIKHGHEIIIVSESWQENVQDVAFNLKIQHLPYPVSDVKSNLTYVDNLVKENGIEILVYQDCYVPNEEIPIKISNNNKIPLIVFEHSTPTRLKNIRCIDNPYSLKGIIKTLFYPFFRRRYIKRDIIRKKELYSNCSRYVMLSKGYVHELKSLMKINDTENKITYLYNPSPSDSISRNIDRMADNEKYNEIVSIGRLEKDKGIDKLLKVWKLVSLQCPDYKLTIVGDGSEKENLLNLAKCLRLRNVSFEGFQNPIPYYRRAKIFLMASKFEGWPMTIIEAMTFGCVPIVENNFSALSDMIENGVNGIIVPKKANTKDWSKLIIMTINNSERLLQMTSKGKENVRRFNVENIVDQWEDLFRDLTNMDSLGHSSPITSQYECLSNC